MEFWQVITWIYGQPLLQILAQLQINLQEFFFSAILTYDNASEFYNVYAHLLSYQQ